MSMKIGIKRSIIGGALAVGIVGAGIGFAAAANAGPNEPTTIVTAVPGAPSAPIPMTPTAIRKVAPVEGTTDVQSALTAASGTPENVIPATPTDLGPVSPSQVGGGITGAH